MPLKKAEVNLYNNMDSNGRMKLPPLKNDGGTNEINKSPTNEYESEISTKSLSLIKKARRQVEDDAKLLANRIALLKQEEIKTAKKIEETKKKALEIYERKKVNEEKHKQKQEAHLREKEMRTTSRIDNPDKNREFLITQRKEKFDEFKKMRDERYTEIRDFKKMQKMKREQQNSQSMNRNVMSHNKILEDKEKAKERVREINERKLQELRQMRMRIYIEEEKIKRRKEADILKMEKLEMDLISKLQSSQLRQKNAYEELESALTLPAKDFEEKYLAQQDKNQEENLKSENDKQSEERDELYSEPNSQNKIENIYDNMNSKLEEEKNNHKSNVLVEKKSDVNKDTPSKDAYERMNSSKKNESQSKNMANESLMRESQKSSKSPRDNQKEEFSSPLAKKQSSTNEKKDVDNESRNLGQTQSFENKEGEEEEDN